MCGEVNIAGRPCVIKTVHAASIVFEEVTDGIVWIVGGLVDRDRTLYEATRETEAGQSQQAKEFEIIFHGNAKIMGIFINSKVAIIVFYKTCWPTIIVNT